MKEVKTNILKIIPLFILLTIFSCSKDAEEPDTPPQVVNEVANLKALNFLNENLNIDWYNDTFRIFENQGYGVSQTQEIKWVKGENDLTIATKKTIDDALLASENITVSDGKSYSGILFGSLNKTMLINEINTTIPQTGNVRIQFANLYESAGEVDIYIGGITAINKKVSNLEYGELSDDVEVSKNDIDARFIITPAGVAPYPGPGLGTNLYNVIDSDLYEANEIYLDVISSETYDASTPINLYLHKI